MVEEIRHLRIRIDGLAKLTKELKPRDFYLIDISMIPSGVAIGDVMDEYLKTGIFQIDTTHATKATPVIQNLETPFKEIEKAVDSLYLSKAWLGRSLKVLAVPNPYKNDGKRKEVSDIEPTADEDKGPNNMVGYNHLVFVYQWKKKNHIEKVDWLRQEIDKLDELLMTMNYNGKFKATDFFFLCYNNARTYLNEARFHLGFELGRLREESKEVMK